MADVEDLSLYMSVLGVVCIYIFFNLEATYPSFFHRADL